MCVTNGIGVMGSLGQGRVWGVERLFSITGRAYNIQTAGPHSRGF